MQTTSASDLSRMVPVIGQRQPFDRNPYRTLLPEGLSIADILDRVPDLPRHFGTHGIVMVNETIVPREMWAYVKPKARSGELTVTVNFFIRLQGGGGGGGSGSGGTSSGKNTFATVATIALLVTATLVSAGAFGAFDALAIGTLTGAQVLGTAITIAGALAIAALSAPPSLPNSVTNPTGPNRDIKPASLQGNVVAAGAALARVLGTKRVYPHVVSPVLVEVINNVEVAEAVFGLAGPHLMEDIRAGNVPIADMAEVEFETQEGWLNSPQQQLVTRQSKSLTPQITLSRHILAPGDDDGLLDQTNPDSGVPNFHRVVTANSPDEAWIHLVWTQGLVVPRAPTTAAATPFRLRLRKRGDANWINLPELHFTNNDGNPYQKNIKIRWVATPYTGTLPSTFPKPRVDGACYLAYTSVPAQAGSPSFGTYTADSSFYNGSGNTYLNNASPQGGGTSGIKNCYLLDDSADIYLDPAVFPKGIYEIEIKRGCSYRKAALTASNYNYANDVVVPQIFDFFEYWQDGSTYATAEEVQQDFKDEVEIVRVVNIWNENPIASGAGIALLAIRVTGRALEQISVLASGYTARYSSTSGLWDDWGISSNPADHYHDVLVGTLGSYQFPGSSVNNQGLIDWRDHCTARGYTINTVIEGLKELDVLNLIASAGYAKFQQSETVGVAMDRDRSGESPVQVFSAGTLGGFKWERGFTNLPDGLRVKYDDAALDYTEQEFIVLDPLATTQGVRLEDIRYEVFDNETDATTRALFDLLQARKRLTFYTGETWAENLVCKRGDLVAVTHDTLTAIAGYSYVQQVLRSGGNITGLVIEASVPTPSDDFFDDTTPFFTQLPSPFFQRPPQLGLFLRQLDGTFLAKQITGEVGVDDSTTLMFLNPFPDPGTSFIDAGCHLVTGQLGKEYKRLIVFNISPKEDLSATLVMVDEVPELWTGALAAHDMPPANPQLAATRRAIQAAWESQADRPQRRPGRFPR